jgi:hypothetical protein
MINRTLEVKNEEANNQKQNQVLINSSSRGTIVSKKNNSFKIHKFPSFP